MSDRIYIIKEEIAMFKDRHDQNSHNWENGHVRMGSDELNCILQAIGAEPISKDQSEPGALDGTNLITIPWYAILVLAKRITELEEKLA